MLPSSGPPAVPWSSAQMSFQRAGSTLEECSTFRPPVRQARDGNSGHVNSLSHQAFGPMGPILGPPPPRSGLLLYFG